MISVLLATTGRPDMAEAFVQSLIDTTHDHEIELVVAVDADPETVLRITKMDRWGQRVHLVLDESPEYRGCSQAWNDALRASTGDPVVLAADDLEFQSGWLQAALTTLSEFEEGWGFVGFNDGHWGPELSTHYMMSRRFIIEILGGVVAWPEYRHSFNDREANARAQNAGRYAWCEQARVLHRHWIFGDRPQDPTDTRLLGDHGWSQHMFEQRSSVGFPNTYKPAITS